VVCISDGDWTFGGVVVLVPGIVQIAFFLGDAEYGSALLKRLNVGIVL
jgi:hypothetical protein